MSRSPLSVARVAMTVVLVGGLARHAAAVCGTPQCNTLAGSDCSTSLCFTSCAGGETELRTAVAAANACNGTPTFARTIRVGGGCSGTCTIDMAQTSTTPTGCETDPISGGRGGVCITGHDITIDGDTNGDGVGDVVFNYSGTGVCQNCSGSCSGMQPSLFTVKGTGNTLRNFTMQYFPEGLHVRTGSNHTVTNVTNQFICEDAMTIDSTAGTGITLSNNVLTGTTTAGGGHTCLNLNGTSGPCGQDKAIQVNGGGSTITGNTINTIGQPVHVLAGTHTISNNSSTGSTTSQNVCQSYTTEGGTTTMDSNTISFCKFGIRADGNGTLIATNNTITDNYVSAFSIRASALVKASGNRMRNDGAFAGSDCQHAGIEVRDSTGPRADFGGGDCNGNAITGGTSAGGNVFCEGSALDIFNGTSGTCTSGTVACMRARSNCFDNGVNQVGSTDTTGATTGCNCSF